MWYLVLTCIYILSDISKIQDNLSDIRSGNLEKLSDQKKICQTKIKIAIKNSFICLTCLLQASIYKIVQT